MTKDDALKLALEALEVANSCVDGYYIPKGKTQLPEVEEAITAIKEALAQPEQEPVAEIVSNVNGFLSTQWSEKWSPNPSDKLYTTPPQRKPLTHLEIWNTYKNLWMFHPAEEPRLAGDVLKFARAIEAAHGIKENT